MKTSSCVMNATKMEAKRSQNSKTLEKIDSLLLLFLRIRFWLCIFVCSEALHFGLWGMGTALPDRLKYKAAYALYFSVSLSLSEQRMFWCQGLCKANKRTNTHTTTYVCVCGTPSLGVARVAKFLVCKSRKSIAIMANLLFISVCPIDTLQPASQRWQLFPHFT